MTIAQGEQTLVVVAYYSAFRGSTAAVAEAVAKARVRCPTPRWS